MEERKKDMKRLVGGDYQLDLSPIEIEESVDGETYTSITDKSVLDQLTGLKTFIGESSMIKPIWIKLLNGETDEFVVTRGSLSTSDGVTFLIKVLLAGFILTLSVEFTQMENEDHEPLDDWYIDTNDAKYILISDTQSLAGELADFEGDVSITGDTDITGDASITGDVSITGDTEFDGDVKCFENIVDAQENKRFIEGNITLDSGMPAGATANYAKWSLSGTHLMIVIALTLDADINIAGNTTLAFVGVPQWIRDKIYPTLSNWVTASSTRAIASDWSEKSVTVSLYKNTTNIQLAFGGTGYTWDKSAVCRFQFDLLIDNETPAP